MRQQGDYTRSYDHGRGGQANRPYSGGNNQQQGRDFASGRFPATSGGNSTHRESTIACPSSSINTQLSAQVAEIMRQGMASARGITAPPSEARSYMTAVSDATILHKQFNQAQQEIADLKLELAKARPPSSINTASASPYSNYGYNV